MDRNPTRVIQDESGFALILVLAMLAILSLLGVMALNTSHSELSISGNFRSSQRAFWAAERAVDYAMTNNDIAGSLNPSTDLNGYKDYIVADNSGLDTSAVNVLRNLGPGELPDYLARRYGRERFGGNFYNISVTGQGPNGRTKVRVETQQVRLFQKDDEGQLISTSGG